MEQIRVVSSDIIQANRKIDPKRVAYFAIEEAGEVTKEITKELRGSGNLENLTKEIADVYYTLSMLRQEKGITVQDINAIILETEDRARKSMKIGPYIERG